MKNKILYQLRIDFDEKAAKELISSKNINSCKELSSVLEEENAKLICQYEAFSLFVKECEQNNLTSTPLYKWTKDTIENKDKKTSILQIIHYNTLCNQFIGWCKKYLIKQ